MSYFYEITLTHSDGAEVSSMIKHEKSFTAEEFSKFHNEAVQILEDESYESDFPNEVEEIANILIERFGFEQVPLQAMVLMSDEICEVNTFDGKVATYMEQPIPEISQEDLDEIAEIISEKNNNKNC